MENALTIPTEKDVASETKKSHNIVETAKSLVIESPEDYETAAKGLKSVKDFSKSVKERKEAITKPLNAALKSARDLFKPIEQSLDDAEGIIKTKMLDFQKKEDAKAAKKKEQIAARVERGTMKPETAVSKMDEVRGASDTIKEAAGSTSTRKVRKVRFTELEKLDGPKIIELALGGYLKWDEPNARRDALAGKELPGVEVYEESVIAVS